MRTRILSVVALIVALLALVPVASADATKPCKKKNCPPVTTTTTSTSSTSTSSTSIPQDRLLPPPITAVGPRYPFSLTDNATVNLAPGRYELQNFTQYLQLSCGEYVFIDSVIAGMNASNPCAEVVLDHVRVDSGLWFEDGSHDGWEIYWSLIDGGPTQALRPKGPGWIVVVDSWLITHDTPDDPNIHTEAMQMMDGASGVFNRVAFSMEPAWFDWDGDGLRAEGTPVTAIVVTDGNAQFTDSIFGYWNQAYGGGAGRWENGGGYYGIYAGAQSLFVNPVIYHQTPWFPPAPTGDRVQNPTYLNVPNA